MTLANAVKAAHANEVQTLADYIVSEFDVTERPSMGKDAAPATGASVRSAIEAWAYMQLNAQDQGD